MTDAREMPEWPEKVDYKLHGTYGYVSEYPILWDEIVAYERARAEAALDRLRVAVEALRKIATRDGIDGYPDDRWCVIANEALSTIGEVPGA